MDGMSTELSVPVTHDSIFFDVCFVNLFNGCRGSWIQLH